MFGNLKRKIEPLGPFEFEHAIEIERPAADVYPMLARAGARNAKRALGNKVERVCPSPERFRMWLDLVPDHLFEMTVTEAVSGERYAFETRIMPSIGRLVSSRETYNLEPLDKSACRLALKVEAAFIGGLTEQELAMEVLMMTISCENALAKLKVQAEQGDGAVHAREAMQMDWGQDCQ